jgi:hypothetical protein
MAMNATISMKRTANNDSVCWLVIATLEGARPSFARHLFAIETSSEQEALGVVGDLLRAERLPRIISVKTRARKPNRQGDCR